MPHGFVLDVGVSLGGETSLVAPGDDDLRGTPLLDTHPSEICGGVVDGARGEGDHFVVPCSGNTLATTSEFNDGPRGRPAEHARTQRYCALRARRGPPGSWKPSHRKTS